MRLLVVDSPGFTTDVQAFQAWANRIRDVGPANFYARDYFSDYPPGYLYLLWLVATVLGGMPAVVAKAMSIPFDVAIALALAVVLGRLVNQRAGVAAASLYLLNPALVIAGTFWGQVDAVGTLPFLLALVAAGYGRFGLAGALAGIAVMVKPQYGLALGLVLAAGTFSILRGSWRPWPLLRALLASVAVIAILALPFRMTLVGERGLVDLVAGAAATYEYSSLYAFNVWAIVADFWKPDAQPIYEVPMRYWSAGLFALGVLGVLAALWRATPRGRRWGEAPRRDVGVMLAMGALLVLAFYFLPTRVHERYLFPLFALTAPAAVLYARVLWTHLAFAAFFFLTVFYSFTRYAPPNARSADLLEATLYQRTGVELMSLAGIGLALLLAARWVRGRDRDIDPRAAEVTQLGRLSLARSPLPPALRPGGRPARRDYVAALILALLVLLTRTYRLDWPRDMYFDEVYHARTATEILAGREPYEFTHPHLAKEIMALSLLAFGGVRASGTTGDPADVTAYASDGNGRRAYARGAALVVVDADGRARDLPRADGDVRALALDRGSLVVLTPRQVAVVAIGSGERRSATLAENARALALAPGFIFVATDTRLVVYSMDLRVEVQAPIAQPVALQPMTDRAVVYVASADGTVRTVSYASGETERTWQAGARVATLTVLPEACGSGRQPTDRCDQLFLGDATEPLLHSINLDTGDVDHVRLDIPRIAPFRGAPRALALSPRTRMVWLLGDDGVAVVEPHGKAPFLAVHDVAGARFLALDDANDAVIAAGGGTAATKISAGRLAFAWRFPGVLAAAILAFFLYLLARRLFVSPLVAYALGALVLVDGAMFAQARIGMNDIYAACGVVVGWYCVVASFAPRRWGSLDLFLAGIAFGLGLAAKWAAGPALLAVGVVALAVSARAFIAGAPGRGGPLDIFRWHGANALYLALCFIVVPIAVYLSTYVPWLGLGHQILEIPAGSWTLADLPRMVESTTGKWTLIELQKQMFSYHSALTAPHPAGSPWWAWPLDLKPVYWEYAQASNNEATYIYDAGNLVTWWAAIPAVAWLGALAIRTRSWNVAIVLLAFGTQYLQFVPVTRVLFQYHFFSALPFFLMALAAALATLWERAEHGTWFAGAVAVPAFVGGVVALAWFYPNSSVMPLWVFGAAAVYVALRSRPEWRPGLEGAIVTGVLVGGLLWFAWFYPWISALPVNGTLASLYLWLPTWQYGCQFYPSFRCG